MKIRRGGAIAVTVFLAGCSFLKRPDNQFYSLDTIPSQGAPRQLSGAPVGIDGIELPPGLDRRGIVLRGADHRFEVRGTHQWAASLEEMVNHTLAFDLANRLPDGMVVLPGQAKPIAPMRSIYLVFEDLAPGPDGVFVLDTRWTVREPARAERTRHERITVQMPSMESPQIATAMSEAVAELADRIAAGL